MTVVQTGWEDLPADHPVRHGLDNEAMFDMLSLFWADLLSSARVLADSRTSPNRATSGDPG